MPKQKVSIMPSAPGTLSFLDKVEEQMARDRILHITGEVNDGMAHELEVRLHYLTSLNNEPITIYLNTPGGSIISGLAIYDTIKEATLCCPVSIIAEGACMSMGVVIMQAATRRLSLPHTQFLLHELSAQAGGSLGALEDTQRFQRYLQGLMDDILAKRTGNDKEKMRKLYHRKNFYITAQDAKKLRLIDAIVEGRK
jgi:ATP-dependent Clp protease protease subunit